MKVKCRGDLVKNDTDFMKVKCRGDFFTRVSFMQRASYMYDKLQ